MLVPVSGGENTTGPDRGGGWVVGRVVGWEGGLGGWGGAWSGIL